MESREIGNPTQLASQKPVAPVPALSITEENPHLSNMLTLFGLDESDVEKYGPKNRLGYNHKTQPVPRHLAKCFAQRFTTSNRA